MIKLLSMLILLETIGCATGGSRETKTPFSAVKRGHISLYNEGALYIEAFDLKLIPPVDENFAFGLNLSKSAGDHAAANALAIVRNWSILERGFKTSLAAGGSVAAFGLATSGSLFDTSYALIRRHSKSSFQTVRSTPLWSWQVSLATFRGVSTLSREWGTVMRSGGDALRSDRAIVGTSVPLVAASASAAAMGGRFAWQGLVDASSTIVAAPRAVVRSFQKVGQNFSSRLPVSDFNGQWRASIDRNEPLQTFSRSMFANASSSFSEGRDESLTRAGRNFSDSVSTYGAVGALVYHAGHATKAILWDSLLAPAGYITAGVVTTAVQSSHLAVDLTLSTLWESTRIAATATYAGGSGVVEAGLGLLEPPAMVVWNLAKVSGGAAVAMVGSVGSVIGAASAVPVAAVSSGLYLGLNFAGFAAEYTGRFLAAPTSALVAGTAAAGTGLLLATSDAAWGVSAATATGIAGTVPGTLGVALGGATAAVGMGAYSVVYGGQSLYYLGKAGLIPPTYALGAAGAVSYGTLSQALGHTVLGVTDTLYLLTSI